MVRVRRSPAPRCEPPEEPLRPGLESCGLAVEDSVVLLALLAAGHPPSEVAKQIAGGVVLTKRTTHGRGKILAAIRRRYADPLKPLPSRESLATILPLLGSPVARGQILLPYLLMADRAAYEVVSTLVLPRRHDGGSLLVTADVVAALVAAFARRGRQPWSPPVCARWARGLLSVLRDVGALGRGADRERLLPYSLRPEVFSFHMWGLYDAGLRGLTLRVSPLWRLLLLDEAEVLLCLRLVTDLGWWRYTTIGSAEEVIPASSSLTEWGAHELGRRAL
jgi:hypothetical protein